MNLPGIIKVIRICSKEKQIQFCENIFLAIPFSIRGILSENDRTGRNKVEVIKQLNEFTYRMQYLILELSSGSENNGITQKIDENVKLYAKENIEAKAELHGIFPFRPKLFRLSFSSLLQGAMQSINLKHKFVF